MKKLLALTVTLCLIAACVPAAADIANLGPYTLDLSKGSYTTAEGQETEAVYNTTYALYEQAPACYNNLNDDSGAFDLDRNGSADLKVTFNYGSSFFELQSLSFEAMPTSSIQGSIRLDVVFNGIPKDSDTAYFYSPFTVIFSDAEPLTEATYTDATGVYSAKYNGEAVYETMSNFNLSSVKIPATISVGGKTYNVTSVAPNAFRKNTKLKKITLGTNIKKIGKNAFNGCTKLKTVSGGANLEIIEDSAFAGCKALTKFTIGAKVTQIGKKAFNKCAALKKITIKTKLLTAKTVGSSAFKGINAGATIKVPKAVKKDYTKWLLKKGVKKTMKIK